MDLSGFEFFTIVMDETLVKQRLPDKFAHLLDGQEPAHVKLWQHSSRGCTWPVEVLFDGEGNMHLHHGWDLFARAYSVQLGSFLVFKFDGHDMLTVKVFDLSMCRRAYFTDDKDEG